MSQLLQQAQPPVQPSAGAGVAAVPLEWLAEFRELAGVVVDGYADERKLVSERTFLAGMAATVDLSAEELANAETALAIHESSPMTRLFPAQKQSRAQKQQQLKAAATQAEFSHQQMISSKSDVLEKIAELAPVAPRLETARKSLRALSRKIFPVTGLHSEQSRSSQFAKTLTALQDAMQKMEVSVQGMRSLVLAERLLKAGAIYYLRDNLSSTDVRFWDQAGQMATLHMQRAVALEPRILTECLSTDEDAPYHREALKPREKSHEFGYRRADGFILFVQAATTFMEKLRRETTTPALRQAAARVVAAAKELHEVRVDFLLDQLQRRHGEPYTEAAAAAAAAAGAPAGAASPSAVVRPLDPVAVRVLDDTSTTVAEALFPVDGDAVKRAAWRAAQVASPAVAELLELLQFDLVPETTAQSVPDASTTAASAAVAALAVMSLGPPAVAAAAAGAGGGVFVDGPDVEADELPAYTEIGGEEGEEETTPGSF
ncbi:hypothetical protein HK405_009645 [Cladochytrium tenue]|nr:hypothetical protein HK405_009645 [Cladochytrium tenue]